MKNRIIIIGGGGHSKVVADAVLCQNTYQIVGFLDDRILPGTPVLPGLPVLGPISGVEQLADKASHFIIAIGSNEIRKKLFTRFISILSPATIIHPSAVISRYATIHPGTVVLANTVINAAVIIRNNCIINSMVLVDHESEICDHSHLAQGSVIGSNCLIPEMFLTSLGQNISSNTRSL